jgi:adenylate kinase
MRATTKRREQKKIVIITGTPGVGKTTLATALVKKRKYERVDLHKVYTQISEKYDQQKQCYIIDQTKLVQLIEKRCKRTLTKGLVIDSHVTHFLPAAMVDLCVVLSCSDLKLLRQRLEKRKYAIVKVQENLEAEIMEVCLNEARERGHKIVRFDTAKMTMVKIVKELGKYL